MKLLFTKTPVFSLSVMPLLLFNNVAIAQMSNAPFSFRNSPGGEAGMSVGGRQAIINEKIMDLRPDNLLRAPGGELLDVQKGPGGSAITSYFGTGQIIPQYRGTGFQGNHPEMAVGVFNGYFLPLTFTSSYDPSSGLLFSGATVSTWTSRVISGGLPLSYLDGNVVDSWTGQVLIMNTAY